MDYGFNGFNGITISIKAFMIYAFFKDPERQNAQMPVAVMKEQKEGRAKELIMNISGWEPRCDPSPPAECRGYDEFLIPLNVEIIMALMSRETHATISEASSYSIL